MLCPIPFLVLLIEFWCPLLAFLRRVVSNHTWLVSINHMSIQVTKVSKGRRALVRSFVSPWRQQTAELFRRFLSFFGARALSCFGFWAVVHLVVNLVQSMNSRIPYQEKMSSRWFIGWWLWNSMDSKVVLLVLYYSLLLLLFCYFRGFYLVVSSLWRSKMIIEIISGQIMAALS